MKTNHRRKNKSKTDRPRAAMLELAGKLSDGTPGYAHVGGDFTNGHRGEAKARSGAKKRLRTLERNAGKQVVRDEAASADNRSQELRDLISGPVVTVVRRELPDLSGVKRVVISAGQLPDERDS